MTTYTEAVTAPASLAAAQYVRAIATRTGFCRVYDPTLGGTVAAVATNLPQVSVVTQHAQFDDAAPWYQNPTDSNNGSAPAHAAIVGEIKVQLVPAAGDVVNASSVQTFSVAAGDIIVTASQV